MKIFITLHLSFLQRRTTGEETEGTNQTMKTDMKKSGAILTLTLLLFGLTGLKAENVPFVYATLVTVDPDEAHVQSAYGHAFLRMQCPSEKLDYCFSLETQGWTQPLNILTGNYEVRLLAKPTAEYVSQFDNDSCHRQLHHYPLNLTTDELKHLWKDLDDTMMEQALPYHDFVKNGCSQGIMNIVMRNINGTLTFDEPKIECYGTTTLGLALKNLHRPSYVETVMPLLANHNAVFGRLEPSQRLFIPTCLPQILASATINDANGTTRPLIKPGTRVESIATRSSFPWTYTWQVVLAAALYTLYIIIERKRKIPRKVAKPLGIILATAYTLLFLLMVWVTSTTRVSVLSGWTWSYLWINPIWVFVAWKFIRPGKGKKVL